LLLLKDSDTYNLGLLNMHLEPHVANDGWLRVRKVGNSTVSYLFIVTKCFRYNKLAHDTMQYSVEEHDVRSSEPVRIQQPIIYHLYLLLHFPSVNDTDTRI